MSMYDLFVQDLKNGAPTDNQLTRFSSRAREFQKCDRTSERLEQLLADVKRRKHELSTKILPDLMKEIGTDNLGLPGSEVDIVLRRYYHANISTDWEPEKRTAAFDHLEKLGGSDIVKVKVDVELPRGEIELARRIAKAIREKFQQATTTVRQDVAWNSLTAFIKDYIENAPGHPDPDRPALDPAILGATIGVACKIEKRKAVKSKRKP